MSTIIETKETMKSRRGKFRFPYYICRGKTRDLIVRLCEIDPHLQDAIENETGYKFAIQINDLQKLYPMKRSTQYRYKAVTEYMKGALDIEMIILTSANKLTDSSVTIIKVDDDK